jgi:hypothetical protein
LSVDGVVEEYYVMTVFPLGGVFSEKQVLVWLHKRWQPLYDEISRTVVPWVEFLRCIPMDLDGDHYFDPRIRNVIVLDDRVGSFPKNRFWFRAITVKFR